MRVTKWQPFREMDDFFRAYQPLFERFAMRPSEGGPGDEWRPAANISESDQEYVIRAELPEVRKEDVEVSVAEGMVTIRGERKLEHEEKKEKLHRVESFYGTFTRSFSLPENADPEGIRAESKDGMLTVRIPKRATEPAQKPRKITVQ